MENKFYKDDNFERFLKDATEDFRMYPSKKVWYSIYNDLHPGRKWPSLAVCLLLITAILFLGVSNNNNINSNNSRTLAQNANSESKLNAQRNVPENSDRINATVVAGSAQNNSLSDERSPATNMSSGSRTFFVPAEEPGISPVIFAQINDDNEDNSGVTATPTETAKQQRAVVNKTVPTSTEKNNDIDVDDDIMADIIASDVAAKTELVFGNDEIAGVNSSPDTKSKPSLANSLHTLNNELSPEDKAWIENYAFNNKASISKFRMKAAIQYYVTPSIGFRFLNKNNNFEAPAQQNLVSTNATPHLGVNNEVTQKSAINMEAGISLLYNVSKKIRLKAGGQLNYTSYISFADDMKHPTQTYLMYNRPDNGFEMIPRGTSYANSITGEKAERLNNKTVQLSLPVGADLKLAGRSNLKWYVGATIQPSFIASGQMYAISSDTKYYVEEPSLLRKWNMSSALETFISFKTPSGAVINLGPQVRYQLFSTYKKEYSYTERLYNIGVKLGITKTF